MINIRIWHKDFITALPKAQLVAQWRELSAAAGNIKNKGTPNHILINKIMDYPFDHFITYAKLIRAEMTKRGYQTRDSVWNKITSLKPDWEEVNYDDLFNNWMDSMYLKICYYNLFEKYLCDGINTKDWEKIKNIYRK